MKKTKQPRKQRKRLYTMPLHRRRRQMSVRLSKELRKKYGRRNFPVRKGDKVRIMKGKYRKKEGKIARVDLVSCKIFVEKIMITKSKGDEILVPIHPSNVMILDLDLLDERRKKSIARSRSTIVVKEKKTEEKPKEEKTEEKEGEK